jgi:hypothetical protein
MFSNQFCEPSVKVERWPVINLFVLAGLLVVLCQLVAMALVVDSNPDKSELRDERNREHVAEKADCLDKMQLDVRSLRHGCIQQVQAERDSAVYADASLQPAILMSPRE